jgi:hypothetical protein
LLKEGMTMNPDPYGGPLNGQQSRQQLCKAIFDAIRCSHLIETGTLTGSTTVFFASNCPTAAITTIESHPQNFRYAQQRLASVPKVTVLFGDSPLSLLTLAEEGEKELTFFYLDAHWHGDCPLRAELALILSRWRSAVILIDDFEVPDDPGYRFDCHAPGKPINLSYIEDLLDGTTGVFFPSVPSQMETGHRRGAVVLGVGKDVSRTLAAMPQLRPYRLPAELS